MSSVIASVKKLFGKITSAVSGVTRKLFGKKKRASRKKNIPANAPVPAPAAPAAPAPVPAPAVPVAPQAAGKMRAKNLRRMKFYKPSRRAVKKGRKLSRRSK